MNKKIESSFIFEKPIIAKENRRRKKIKKILVFLSLFVVFVSAVTFYFLSDYSKIYRINFKGNKLLSDDYLKNLNYVKESDYYLFSFDSQIEKKFLKNKLIDDVKVKHLKHNIIEVEVKEKKIVGYTFEEKPIIYDCNGNQIEMLENSQFLISKIPFIEGFDKEVTKEIVKYFKDVNADIISEISEIRKYNFSYDENTLMVVFRDGNYFFVSKEGLKLLNNAHGIISNLKVKPSCIFVDEVTNSAYSSTCPWKNGNNKNDNNEHKENLNEQNNEKPNESTN